MSSKLLQNAQSASFRLALFVSLLLCLAIALFVGVYGKIDSFLLINRHHTPFLDILFQYATFLGDGIIYVPLLAYCLFFNRRIIVPAVLSILICLLLTHVLKRVIFPDALRPISLEAQHYSLHKIAGVRINRVHSFPSGHTATAFATALLLAAVVRKKAWAIVLPLVPFAVGYSRVYLAQHFPTDVLGGALIGIVTTVLSLWLQPRLTKALPPSWQAKLHPPITP